MGKPVSGIDSRHSGHHWLQRARQGLAGPCLRLPARPFWPSTSTVQGARGRAKTEARRHLSSLALHGLARLWQHQGKRQEARDLLAPVYTWFTAGFETPDV